MVLSEGFLVTTLAFHLGNELVAVINLGLKLVREHIKDFVFSIRSRQGFLDLVLAVNLVVHLISLVVFKLLELLITFDFSGDLSLGLSRLELTVESIVFLVNLAFELFIDLQLS